MQALENLSSLQAIMDSTVQPAKHAVRVDPLEKLPHDAPAALSDGRRGAHAALGHDDILTGAVCPRYTDTGCSDGS